MSLFKVVGLGPGDPELITMKGYKAIMDADIVFYPKTSLNSFFVILLFFLKSTPSSSSEILP